MTGPQKTPPALGDTSGEVWWPGPEGRSLEWSDLDAFTQGYIGALFASLSDYLLVRAMSTDRPAARIGFSDLAPETLARIIRDCANFQTENAEHLGVRHETYTEGAARTAGRHFWLARNRLIAPYDAFRDWPGPRRARTFAAASGAPPLTATLSDDGKVRLGAQPQAKHREDQK